MEIQLFEKLKCKEKIFRSPHVKLKRKIK